MALFCGWEFTAASADNMYTLENVADNMYTLENIAAVIFFFFATKYACVSTALFGRFQMHVMQ